MSDMTEPASPGPPTTPPPTIRPPKQRSPDLASIVVGLVILGVGIWYFLDTTLGLTMPRIGWGELWPLLLIVIGGLILVRAATDRSR
jgi:hypothetical protein